MVKAIYFDMDGTIADFYGVEGWLDYLMAQDTTPYAQAKPLVNMSRLARRLNALQAKGFTIGIISWLSRNGTDDYNTAVTQVKTAWLRKHLASVHFDSVQIVKYGTPKQTLGKGILFDDELPNRQNWGEGAYAPQDIFAVLAEL